MLILYFYFWCSGVLRIFNYLDQEERVRACNNMATVLVRVLRKHHMYQEMVHRMERWKGKKRMTKTLNVYLGKQLLDKIFCFWFF